jgi:hypothetical protein
MHAVPHDTVDDSIGRPNEFAEIFPRVLGDLASGQGNVARMSTEATIPSTTIVAYLGESRPMKSRMAWRSSVACGAHRIRLTPRIAS